MRKSLIPLLACIFAATIARAEYALWYPLYDDEVVVVENGGSGAGTIGSTGGKAPQDAYAARSMRAASSQDQYVLWFSVMNNAILETEGGDTMTVGYFAGKTGANAARIRVVESGMPTDTFLDLYFEEDGVWMTAAGLNVADLDNTGSLEWQAAALGVYAEEGNAFVLEIGQIDSAGNNFVALASAQSTFSELQSGGHVSTGGISTQVQTPWSPPTFYAIATSVPEPSTGLLALFGAVLMFRRRR